MKSLLSNRASVRNGSRAGFTLTEALVATALFALVSTAMIALYLFSGRLTSAVSRSLELSSRAGVLDVLSSEIKSSQVASVGNYDGMAFTPIPVGQAQQGNALRLTISTGGTNTRQSLYWVDSSKQLVRWDLNSNRTKIYLNDITNQLPFTSQTFGGAVISNQLARTLIDMNLCILDSNPNNFRQYLKLQATAEKRNL